MSAWVLLLGGFVPGAVTGKWWSKRKAVTAAYASGHASASASASAGHQVVFSGPMTAGQAGEISSRFDEHYPDNWSTVNRRNLDNLAAISEQHDDHDPDGYYLDFGRGTVRGVGAGGRLSGVDSCDVVADHGGAVHAPRHSRGGPPQVGPVKG